MGPLTKSGRPIWVDLGTTDIESSQAFYKAVFNWDFHEFTYEDGSYVTASIDGRPVGGMMSHSKEQLAMGIPATWSVFFATADIDGDVARAEVAGARVVQPPFPIPSGDRIALLADPVGALFALATFSEVEEGRMLWDQPGTVCWIECQTRDVEASVAFYETFFGWSSKRSDTYVMFELDGESVAGMLPMPDGVPAELGSAWFVYWMVEDLDQTAATAREAGGTEVTGVMTIDEGRFTVVEDPTGAAIGLFQTVPAG